MEKIEKVCEILKLRGADRICVREDMKGASFDSTSVPFVADIKGILRCFYKNVDDMLLDGAWRGYFGIMLVYLCDGEFKKRIDKKSLELYVKYTDVEKVREILSK